MKNLLTPLLLCFAIPLWLSAQLNFNVESQSASPSSVVTIPIQVTTSQAIPAMGIQFSIQWDANVLHFEQVHGFNLNDMSLQDFGLPESTGHTNQLNFLWETYPSFTALSNATTLFYIDFTVLSNVSVGTTTTVNFCSDCTKESYDYALTALSNTFQSGQVTVTQSLAVELLNFSAQVTPKQQVQLQWLTQQEIKQSHYDIERSPTGQDWAFVGKVASQSSISKHTYHFLDSQPLLGKSYYRLKAVDHDGAFSYSEIQQVFISKKLNISCQNLVQNTIRLFCQSEEEQVLEMQLYNVNGRWVKNFQEIIPVGVTECLLNVSEVAKGTYFLKIQQQELVFKIVKWE